MRILFVINALTIGGAQVWLLDLVKSLVEKDNTVVVAAFRDGSLKKDFISAGATLYLLGEECLDIKPSYKLVQLIQGFQPDIVHSHLFRATAWARWAKLLSNHKFKLITTIHGQETTAFHLLEAAFHGLSDYTIFPSQFMKNWYFDLVRELPEDSSEIIFPGTNINAPRKSKEPKEFTIGTISRLDSVKGLDILIKAAKLLVDRDFDFKIKILGKGKAHDSLVALVNKLQLQSKFQFIEEVADKAQFIEGLSLLVAPSRKEAFGINICEAMERSLPVVTTRVGGIPEIVKDGVTGWLCQSDNPEDLADKLEFMINNPAFRQKAGKEGRKVVEDSFNRSNGLEEHIMLYEKMTNKKSVHFAISSKELGGGERLALDLVKNLQSRGWTVTATCAGSPLFDELKALNVKTSVAPMIYEGLLFGYQLCQDLKAFKPAVISSHLNKASLCAGVIGRLLGIKSVAHVHGLNKKIYYQFSNKQIAVSAAVKKHLEDQGLKGSSLVTINNSIDKPAVGSRTFPNRPLNIAITAKLHANKGHKWALEALSKNIEKLSIGKVHIFGDGPERQNLESLCNSLESIKDKVVFHGFVNDPSEFYNEIDLALLPSLGEGIPLSLLEVMRLGIPCISTNVGGVPEIVLNGKSGILVEPKDEAALIEAINKLSEKETYESYSKEAFKRFSIVNDHKKMIDEFEKQLLE